MRERLTASGDVLRPLDEQHLRALCETLRSEGAQAIAVCLLFSYVNTAHEERVAEILREELPDVPVTLSHNVAPIWREYERSSTTIADAYLKPLLAALCQQPRRVAASDGLVGDRGRS